MEVGLPVNGIVLIGPGHVPDGGTRPGHRGESVARCSQGVLGIVPLDKQRQRLTVGFCHDAREEAHPPAVVFHVNTAVQRTGIVLFRIQVGFAGTDGAQRVLSKVVVVDGVRRRAPHEIGTVNLLAGSAQLGAFLQVKHLAADDNGLGGVAGRLNRTQYGVRLDGDVIVHVEDEGRIGIFQCLVHDAGVAARAAQIALAELAETIAKVGRCLVVARLISGVLVALVRHEDEVDDFICHRILGQCLECCHGIGRAVKGRNTDCHALVLRRLLGPIRQHLRAGGVGGAPGGVGKRGFLLGGDIEPQPTAVLEVFEWQLKLVVAGAYQVVGHGNTLAILLRPVQGNICLALNV